MAAVALFAMTGSSYAIPTIKLYDGVTTVSVLDGSGSDLDPAPGIVTWFGPVGVWQINVTTGTSSGSAASPFLDLNSVNASSTAGGTLTVSFSDTGFGPSDGGVGVSVGGTAAGTVQFETYADAGNGLFTLTTLLTSQSFGAGGFSGAASASLALPASYSLTEVATITHAAGEEATSFEGQLHVPDGGTTAWLLGITLSGLALLKPLRRSLS